MLLAENVEVLVPPPPADPRSRRNTAESFAVLQMPPGDAHTTMLALSTGASLRFVFRPFNDAERVTEPPALAQTTYPPRDARSVDIIRGTARSVQQARLGGMGDEDAVSEE